MKNTEEGIVYFLTLLSAETSKFNEDGYRKLYSKYLQNILGHSYPNYIKLLINNEIIEKKNYRSGSYSTGYRLKSPYNLGEYSEIPLGEKIIENIKKVANEFENSGDYIPNYQYALDQFQKYTISIDLEVYNFLKIIYTEIFQKIDTLMVFRKETLMKTLDHLGRYLIFTENIQTGNYNPIIAGSNHRLHSALTEYPKILRPYLLINGCQVGEVDISSSQPYILSSILNPTFAESQIPGFNLFSIHPELFNKFRDVKRFIPRSSGSRNYLLGVYFSDLEYENLSGFTDFNFFESDFYDSILERNQVLNLGRNQVKSQMMKFLFDSHEIRRQDNQTIRLIASAFSSLNHFIEHFLSVFGKSTFAILLQRTESYLVLGQVCELINQNQPEIPFYTIHDSIITTEDKIDDVKNIMVQKIMEVTGKEVRVKCKVLEKTEITPAIIDDLWKKVRIGTVKKYEKQEYSLIPVNMNKGSRFLFDKDYSDIIREYCPD